MGYPLLFSIYYFQMYLKCATLISSLVCVLSSTLSLIPGNMFLIDILGIPFKFGGGNCTQCYALMC